MTKPFLSSHATDKYRPDIDGLRAFAVLSVVLHHAFPQAVRGGFVGVDVESKRPNHGTTRMAQGDVGPLKQVL